ncbi:MAG: hypothetical protein LBP59_11930 [Planctomycetaceae bacterium]|nr:hypothetical protein [Planctomycetaceae bacterium]
MTIETNETKGTIGTIGRIASVLIVGETIAFILKNVLYIDKYKIHIKIQTSKISKRIIRL